MIAVLAIGLGGGGLLAAMFFLGWWTGKRTALLRARQECLDVATRARYEIEMCAAMHCADRVIEL